MNSHSGSPFLMHEAREKRTSAPRRDTTPRRRLSVGARILLVAVVVVAGLLAGIRIVGSPLATAWANRKLADLPDFRGQVGAVHLSLWRGTIDVQDFHLESRQGPADSPAVRVRDASLSVAWLPLFKGRLGGHGRISGLEVAMVKEADSAKDDAEKTERSLSRPWQGVLQEAFPIEITRFEVTDGRVRFEDRSRDPTAALVIDQIHLVATDLSNRSSGETQMPARVDFRARVGESGKLAVEARADPAAPWPRFHATLQLTGLSLPRIHDFLLAYALIDVSAGEFELYSEVEGAGGGYHGFIKPFFRDLDFKAVPDPEKNLVQRAATKVASAVTGLLQNDEGAVATEAPFSGNFEDNDVDVWTTIENLLRNAFVQSLRAGLDRAENGTERS